jgi:penicillin-binding protein 1C
VTVAVWAGDFTGKPMRNVSGITGAGPIFRDIIQLAAARGPQEDFDEPKTIIHARICPISGLLPGPHCAGVIDEIFAPGTAPTEICRLTHGPEERTRRGGGAAAPAAPPGGLAIVSPQDGDIFKIDPVLRGAYQSIRLRAEFGAGAEAATVEWWVDGRRIGEDGPPFARVWNLKPGSYTMRARARLNGTIVESRPVRITVLS